MPKAFIFAPVCSLAIAGALVLCSIAPGQTVWSGYGFTFTKAAFASPTLPENQDRLTGNVWISRDANQGIFNVHDEPAFLPTSPSGTQWATYINNPTKTIAATNFSNLVFADWIDAYGGQGGMTLPGRLTGGPAVLHLIADDIYLDLQFTNWVSGGGAFTYNRSLAPMPLQPTGDYNSNGVVDAADYVVWRNTNGQTGVTQGTGADGNANGSIDPGDYDFWRVRFGNSAAGGSLSQGGAVPEPHALSLVLISLFAVTIHATSRERLRTSSSARRGGHE